MDAYRAPGWLSGSGLVGGNTQTIWPALFSRPFLGPRPAYRARALDHARRRLRRRRPSRARRRRAARRRHRCSCSSTAWKAHRAATTRWPSGTGPSSMAGTTPCRISAAARGELNLAPRAYHSGDYEEIGWMLARLRAAHRGPIVAVGVSLGGNALLRWAGGGWRHGGADGRRRLRDQFAGRPGGRRARRSGAASTGWSTRACSCAP